MIMMAAGRLDEAADQQEPTGLTISSRSSQGCSSAPSWATYAADAAGGEQHH